MPGEPLVKNALMCPHCRALNAPNTLVCRSCGINLPAYQESQARLRELQVDSATVHASRLEADSSESVARAVADGRRQLARQVRALLILGTLLAIMIVIGAMLYANYLERRREQLALQYQQATVCLIHGEYRCARDGFTAVLQEEPTYSDAARQLQAARAGLAEQYARAGQWRGAVDELDGLLQVDPSDHRALDLLRDVYNRWYEDALAKGDILTALRIEMERHARFPEPIPPPTTDTHLSG